jgi:biotin operon repressor
VVACPIPLTHFTFIMEDKFLKVPDTILELKDLNGDDKLMLCQIFAYHVNNGCIASNQYFANRLGYSRTAASERIAKLKKLGYIQTSSYTHNNKTYRKIIPLDWTKRTKEVVGLLEGTCRFA